MSTPHPTSPQDHSGSPTTPAAWAESVPTRPAPGQPMPSYTEGGPDRAAYPQPPYSSPPQDGYPQQGYPQPSTPPYGAQPPYGIPSADADRQAAARRTLIWGAIWLFGGIVLTVVFLIGSHGTRVPFFWGASIYGVIQLVRGGIAMSKANA